MSLLRRLPRYRTVYEQLAELGARENWSREHIEAWQLERLNRLWSQAVDSVPYYCEMKARQALPARFESLDEFRSRVPILDKRFVREHGRELLSRRAGAGDWHHTSGSSGAATPVFRTASAHQEMLRSRYRFNQVWGVDIFDRWAFIWGNAEALAPGFAGFRARFQTPLKDWLRNRIRLSPYDLSRDELARHLQRLRTSGTVAIYSHTMAMHLLAEEALRQGVRLPALKLIVLTAEPVRPATVALIERAFGVPAVTEYGAVECGFIAGEAPDRTLRVREDHVLLETVPDGDRHRIVVSVLNNPEFPLLRYALGDMTEQPLTLPETGFAILGPVTGRDFDLVVTASGRLLHGQIFEDIVDKYPAVRRWQLRQACDGSVAVQIECEVAESEALLSTLRNRFSAQIDGFDVTVDAVDHMPPSRSGKHRTLMSDLGARHRDATLLQPPHVPGH